METTPLLPASAPPTSHTDPPISEDAPCSEPQAQTPEEDKNPPRPSPWWVEVIAGLIVVGSGSCFVAFVYYWTFCVWLGWDDEPAMFPFQIAIPCFCG